MKGDPSERKNGEETTCADFEECATKSNKCGSTYIAEFIMHDKYDPLCLCTDSGILLEIIQKSYPSRKGRCVVLRKRK